MADIKIIVDSSDVVTADNRIDQLGKSGAVAQKGIGKASRGMNQFGKVSAMGGKKMNTFNMQIQQGGYQLQDFVVQLQGGTSVFTAFGQQGSQFAGVFGPQGAVIGAVIAIGSAVGGMAYKMLTAGEEVREFQEILEDTSDILERLADANKAAAMSNKELEDSFGSASVQIKSTLALLRGIAQNEAQRAIDDLAASLTDLYSVGGDGERRGGIAKLFDVNIMFALSKGAKAARKEARILTAEFVNAQDALSASKGNIEGQIEATQRLLNVAITLSDVNGSRSEEEEALIKKLSESLLTMQETQTVKETTLSTYKDILGTEESLAEATEALNELFEARLGTIDDTANLYEDILGSSKGLSQAESALNDLYENRLGTIDDTANLYVDILGSSEGLSQAESALNDLYENRLGTIDDTANLYEDILGSAEGLEEANQANNDLYQQHLDKLEAQKLVMLDMVALAATYGSLAAGEFMDQPIGVGAFGGLGDYRYDEDSTFTPEGFGKKPREKKPSKDPIAEFQKKLDLEREQLGVSEARQKVLQALGSDIVAKNPEIVAGMEAQITKTNDLIALEKERQGVIDSITGSMETGFMAMIDGTMSVKDAFKQMAADIIKELMRVYVVQQMVNAAKMFFGLPFADGGAFSGGSQIQAYADGGVVGSPTTFPMAGGKTGLMGEAGPEAIMPLKRGANGKLGVQMEGGGGQSVVINQSFNFQANGDDSVKKLIAQAAPQIANLTKKSMLDDRRRGGQMKATFG